MTMGISIMTILKLCNHLIDGFGPLNFHYNKYICLFKGPSPSIPLIYILFSLFFFNLSSFFLRNNTVILFKEKPNRLELKKKDAEEHPLSTPNTC